MLLLVSMRIPRRSGRSDSAVNSMTSVAMIAGMIPVALARGDGAETRVPMGVAIIGGLLTSTVLTLGIVPVVYSLLDDLRNRFFKPAVKRVPDKETQKAPDAAA